MAGNDGRVVTDDPQVHPEARASNRRQSRRDSQRRSGGIDLSTKSNPQSSPASSGKRHSHVRLENTIADRTAHLLKTLSQSASKRSLRDVLSLSTRGHPSSLKRLTGVTELDHDDLEVGKLLGKGGFSHVYEVKSVKRTSFLTSDEIEAAFGNIDTANCCDDKSDDNPESASTNYVVKHLKSSLVQEEDKDTFNLAAADLALEAKILSLVNHPNVIRLRGVTRGCAASAFFSEESLHAADGCDGRNNDGYFLVLDKLDSTLEERCQEWREEARSIRSIGRGPRLPKAVLGGKEVGRRRRKLKQEFLARRLDVARQVARGMSHLHSRRILYRDVKPGNVGFNASTKAAQIFDFGLALFLPTGDDEENFAADIAGTPRYMAPEVAQCRPYGFPADVYSFGLLLWEILAMERPFGKIRTPEELQDKVVYGTKRPKVDYLRWPEAVCRVMERCWSADPADRPVFKEVVDVLEEELNVCDGVSPADNQ